MCEKYTKFGAFFPLKKFLNMLQYYYRVKMDELEIEKYLRLRGRISVFLSNAED